MSDEIPFKEVEIKHVGDPDPAVGAPKNYHPAVPDGWDTGIQVYQEAFGEEAWEEWKHNSYPRPMPDDDLLDRLGFKALMVKSRLAFDFKALTSGRRATHTTGVAGRGKLTIVSDPQFPTSAIFTPGKTYDCRLRHANASFSDDAAAVVRSCAIKLADTEFESPLDIIMNSGPIGAFWNLESFMDFVSARTRCEPTEGDWEAQTEWTRRRPMGFIGSIESIRHAPASYAEVMYYSKVVFPYRGDDGNDYYLKYRIVLDGLEQESGLPSHRRQLIIGNQARDEDDTRPLDYLRREYEGRVAAGPVEYTLQIQIRPADPEHDTHELFNMDHLWPEDEIPYVDLAHVQVTEIIPTSVTDQMRMWLGNQPENMGILEAYSSYDYRSMAHARAVVYPGAQCARRVYRKFRGDPGPVPDEPFAC